MGYDARTFTIAQGRRVASLISQYPAATGQGQIGDYDDARFQASGNATALVWFRLRTAMVQQMASRMNGNVIPVANSTQTWTVSPSGGVTPYQQNWYRNGSWVKSGSSYTANTGSTDFSLRVETTDAYSRTAADFKEIDVDGVRVTMSGPTIVYLSQGGGTWTASGQGGYPPYTYDWYVDGTRVGGGSSWQGYPGEGPRELRIQMKDSRQATYGVTKEVTGLGSGGCQPVPPQVTCD